MKGFLSKLGGPPTFTSPEVGGAGAGGASAGASSGGGGGGFIGKTFHLHRYQLVVEEKIAEGGFAVVFKVRNLSDGRVLALKRMCVNSENSLQICQREITIVRSLTHKNIIKYVDDCINHLPNGVYEVLLLLAYCKSTVVGQLNDCTQAGTHLSEAQILRIFCDVCEAVSRLHHCHTPVQHRDLKVENVLIDDSGNYVLCDFGSATVRVLQPALQGAAPVEEEIQKYTTLAYRSPEMVDPYSGRPIDTKADIWALGCMLYKLAYFSLPFGESTLAISAGRLSLPDQPAYSPELRKLIRHALQPDPGHRPDIYQVCHLAFQLAGRPNPVQNVYKSEIPRYELLPAPPTESECREMSKSPSVGRLSSQPASAAAAVAAPTQSPPSPSAVTAVQKPPVVAMPLAAPASGGVGFARQRPRPLQQQPLQQWVTLEPQLPQPPLAAQHHPGGSSNRSSSLFDIRVGAGVGGGDWPQERHPSGQQYPTSAVAGSFASASASAASGIAANAANSSFDHRLRHASSPPPPPPPTLPKVELTAAAVASWNPFAENYSPPPPLPHPQAATATVGGGDGNSSEDALEDAMFGMEFDRIRRAGSQSSMAAQKSREDLVMEEPAFDPFSAAPFNPRLKSKHSSGSGGGGGGGGSVGEKSKKSRAKRDRRRAAAAAGAAATGVSAADHQLHYQHRRAADADWLCVGSDNEATSATALERSGGRSDLLFAAIPFRKDPDDKSRYEQLGHCYSDEDSASAAMAAATGANFHSDSINRNNSSKRAALADAASHHQQPPLPPAPRQQRLPSRETSSDGLDEYGTDAGAPRGGADGAAGVGVGAAGASGAGRLFNYVTLTEDPDAHSVDSRTFDAGSLCGGGYGGTAEKASSVLSFSDYDTPQQPALPPLPPSSTSATQLAPPAAAGGADRIVGHQYGVRPLLDDDELSDSERLSDAGAGSVNDVAETSDPFSLAPFNPRPKPRRQRRGNAVQKAPSKAATKLPMATVMAASAAAATLAEDSDFDPRAGEPPRLQQQPPPPPMPLTLPQPPAPAVTPIVSAMTTMTLSAMSSPYGPQRRRQLPVPTSVAQSAPAAAAATAAVVDEPLPQIGVVGGEFFYEQSDEEAGAALVPDTADADAAACAEPAAAVSSPVSVKPKLSGRFRHFHPQPSPAAASMAALPTAHSSELPNALAAATAAAISASGGVGVSVGGKKAKKKVAAAFANLSFVDFDSAGEESATAAVSQ